MSNLEFAFDALCLRIGLPEPESEARFDPVRKWRFDRLWRAARLAVELEGGTYGKQVICNHCKKPVSFRMTTGRLVPVRMPGRHNSPEGYANDAEKYNAAALAGYMVLRFTADMLRDGRAESTLRDMRGIVENA